MLKFNKNIGVLVIYCLPAALACAMLSYSLYTRSMEVSHEITRNVDSIRKGGKTQTAEMKASFSKDKDDRDAFKNSFSETFTAQGFTGCCSENFSWYGESL